MNGFIECDTCREKSGSPTLCRGCFENRKTISDLKLKVSSLEKKKMKDPAKIHLYPIFKYFKYDHLPEHLQAVSKPFSELAETFLEDLPDGPEKAAGLRKLLEAKDCFVRAMIQ